jgi:hypothetical protein
MTKPKDLIKIFADSCLESIQNLIFKIIPRFTTDPVQDLDKNGRKDFIKKLAGICSRSIKYLWSYIY